MQFIDQCTIDVQAGDGRGREGFRERDRHDAGAEGLPRLARLRAFEHRAAEVDTNHPKPFFDEPFGNPARARAELENFAAFGQELLRRPHVVLEIVAASSGNVVIEKATLVEEAAAKPAQ